MLLILNYHNMDLWGDIIQPFFNILLIKFLQS